MFLKFFIHVSLWLYRHRKRVNYLAEKACIKSRRGNSCIRIKIDLSL